MDPRSLTVFFLTENAVSWFSLTCCPKNRTWSMNRVNRASRPIIHHTHILRLSNTACNLFHAHPFTGETTLLEAAFLKHTQVSILTVCRVTTCCLKHPAQILITLHVRSCYILCLPSTHLSVNTVLLCLCFSVSNTNSYAFNVLHNDSDWSHWTSTHTVLCNSLSFWIIFFQRTHCGR